MIVAPGWSIEKMGHVGQKTQSFIYEGWISSGDLMHSIETIVNNTISDSWNLLRVA